MLTHVTQLIITQHSMSRFGDPSVAVNAFIDYLENGKCNNTYSKQSL